MEAFQAVLAVLRTPRVRLSCSVSAGLVSDFLPLHVHQFQVCWYSSNIVVIFPAIAQRLADDSGIPIHSAQILKPTPNGIVFSLSATLDVPLGLSVQIDPFNLSLFNRDREPRTPYVSVELQAFHLKGKSEIIITNQTTNILDMDQFTQFLSVAVYSKNFTLSAYGKTTAHLGALKAPLTLNKDVTLNGMFHTQVYRYLGFWLLYRIGHAKRVYY